MGPSTDAGLSFRESGAGLRKVHRDVRPETILMVTPARALIGDLHFACSVGNEEQMAKRVRPPGARVSTAQALPPKRT